MALSDPENLLGVGADDDGRLAMPFVQGKLVHAQPPHPPQIGDRHILGKTQRVDFLHRVPRQIQQRGDLLDRHQPNERLDPIHHRLNQAAGTGRYLEIMSASLGHSFAEFASAAQTSSKSVPINSKCALFAESEVVSLRNRGYAAANIARAIHLSVADRLKGMLERVGILAEIVFTGGVANNQFLVDMLADKLGRPVIVPEQPELVGAIAAALHQEKR